MVRALFASSILLLISNLLLYPVFGITVSAIVRVISTTLVTSAIIIFVSKKLYKTKFLKFLPKIFLSLAIMSLCVFFTKEINLFLSILVGAITYFAALFIFKLFDQQDLYYWQAIYNQFRNRNEK